MANHRICMNPREFSSKHVCDYTIFTTRRAAFSDGACDKIRPEVGNLQRYGAWERVFDDDYIKKGDDSN